MDLSLFDRSNVAAWCVVPYDSRERTPAQRAAMLRELGFTQMFYDWRDEHVAQFPAELDSLAAEGVALAGLWVPHTLPGGDDALLGEIAPEVHTFIAELASRALTPDLWTCVEFGEPGPFVPLDPQAHAAMRARVTDHLEPMVRLAAESGLRVALYNHLGWFGEPQNQIEVIEGLRARGLANVGLVYQQHHGHAHIEGFEALLATMKPYLYALGVTGMVTGAHWGGRKIHPYGHGENDVALARAIAESGWRGTLTTICHTMDDAELRLRDNLEGMDWVVATLRGESPAKPVPRIPEPVWPH